MRKVDLIVIHCSATPPQVRLSPEELDVSLFCKDSLI